MIAKIRKCHLRIQEFEVNAYAFGRQFAKIPDDERSTEEFTTSFWLSRDAYERVLRRLVLSSSDRIRWITGTVTGLRTDTKDISALSSVVVRIEAGNELDIPATLVVGEFAYLFCIHELLANFVHRLQRKVSGRSEMATANIDDVRKRGGIEKTQASIRSIMGQAQSVLQL